MLACGVQQCAAPFPSVVRSECFHLAPDKRANTFVASSSSPSLSSSRVHVVGVAPVKSNAIVRTSTGTRPLQGRRAARHVSWYAYICHIIQIFIHIQYLSWCVGGPTPTPNSNDRALSKVSFLIGPAEFGKGCGRERHNNIIPIVACRHHYLMAIAIRWRGLRSIHVRTHKEMRTRVCQVRL